VDISATLSLFVNDADREMYHSVDYLILATVRDTVISDTTNFEKFVRLEKPGRCRRYSNKIRAR